MPNTPTVTEQGQGKRCATCNHHVLYHSSWGSCMVLGCTCEEWLPIEEKNDSLKEGK